MTGDGKKKLEAHTFNQNFAKRDLACTIIMHEYPLSMVEHAGFKRFALALQPLFQMVPRNTLKADIFRIYDGERLKAIKTIDKIQSRVATDMWTSSNKKRRFMVIIGHYVDDSWKLQSIILRFIYVPCPHTVEGIQEYSPVGAHC
ncbi:zinc finger BED domain-containing protein DAYSLEEPER-like [Rhododendron vialii]|uniref:zinc finger BED domain-containing protein DAYSLEEPER-like n=1 Tax=Rhododendron vialii TaxID=182163 RepID=UPI002660230A|nr:zinc finger BED domain-containing protein DAYSLEEPER-like [Rhododendron vialii]